MLILERVLNITGCQVICLRAKDFLNEFIRPPRFHFQRTLENMCSFHEMMIKSLFKFVQGAAHLWDLHEIGLARQERKLQVQLLTTLFCHFVVSSSVL